jgi:hypothetical protein
MPWGHALEVRGSLGKSFYPKVVDVVSSLVLKRNEQLDLDHYSQFKRPIRSNDTDHGPNRLVHPFV